MSWQSDVGNGIAQRLNDVGVGTWGPDDDTGNISRGAIKPDVCPAIGIQTYRVGPDDPQHPTTQLRVQFRLRAADIDALDDLDAAIYDAFTGLNDVWFGDTHVTDTGTISSLGADPDANGNLGRTCNYSMQLDLPSTALRSY